MNDVDLQLHTLHWVRRLLRGLLAVVVCLPILLAGCAAISNPVGDGIPVRFLPDEAFGESKDAYKQIPLSYLRQPAPEIYRLAAGDVLGIWIEGILGEKNAPPPVQVSQQGNQNSSIGFPIPVNDEGTISLPLIEPLKVDGMSLNEVRAEIIKAYTVTKKLLQPGQARVIVTLQQPRRYHVLVVREDTGSVSFGSTGGFGGFNGGTSVTETRRSTGVSLDLPAYENDLMNALTRTGGIPGFEAEEFIVITRGSTKNSINTGAAPRAAGSPGQQCPAPGGSDSQAGTTIRVPLRMRLGETPNIPQSDIILQNGDIVNVRARKGEVFYTAGLLPPRVFPLPRERDLNILEALVLVGAPLINGGLGVNNLSGQISAGGIGAPSPSLVTVLRLTNDGTQIPIRVSLNRAFRDPRERIRVLPGDVIVLQETTIESLTRYVTNVWRWNFNGTVIRQQDLTGASNLNVP